MFSDFCQNILELIGSRVVSLRLTLTNTIGGWSLVSSSLRYHQLTLLQRLHLIDIQPHEFDKLLRSRLMKRLHTLIVDLTKWNLYQNQTVEGSYLAKVCSQLPSLKICRLPFNHHPKCVNQLEKYSLSFPTILPNLSNTNHLRTLVIGVHTLCFLERLLSRIPFIENLSVGISTFSIDQDNERGIISLPASADTNLLRYLSRLHIHCKSNFSFYQAMALFSSVFDQLNHLSLKLEVSTFISGPLSISGDTIQRLCIDRLRPWATYALNLDFSVANDLETKIIFNGFLNVPFVHRKRPTVYIQECHNWHVGYDYHCFLIFTSYNETTLRTILFSEDLKRSWDLSANPMNLFPRANELFLCGNKKENRLSELMNCRSSVSSMIPWPLLTKITVDDGDVITASVLESILRMAHNVHTLEIYDDRESLPRAILRNHGNLGTRINEQIKSLSIKDRTLTLQNAQRFCTLLSNRSPNLRKLSFNICASYDTWRWIPSRIVDKNKKSTKRVVNLIYYLIDHLQQLVSLYITFHVWSISQTPYFPHLIRQQLHRYPPSRSYRLRCSPYMIQIWL